MQANRRYLTEQIAIIQGVLDRLPDEALDCTVYIPSIETSQPEILFFGSAFKAAVKVFPYTKPVLGAPLDDGYATEAFQVDGVRLCHMVKVKAETE